jgi:hypothetical protein
MADNNDEYAVGDDGNNKPLAEGNNKDNDEYTSATCCTQSSILSDFGPWTSV